MAGISESRRKQVALILTGFGTALIIIGFLMIVGHTMDADSSAPISIEKAPVPKEVRLQALRQILFWLVVFFLIFSVSVMAFLRWSRRYRRNLLRRPRPPTPSEDVWAMHKLPEGAVEEWTEPEEK